jgi:urease accessory protein
MLVARHRIAPAPHDASLALTYEMRQRTRLRTLLADGEEVALLLERGNVLRGGDCLRADDGRVLQVAAADEDLLEVCGDGAAATARIAYHLGNRHCAVEIGDGWLRFAADAVLADMVRGLGAEPRPVRAPFEPERGDYGGGHHARAPASGQRGVIHEFAGQRPLSR